MTIPDLRNDFDARRRIDNGNGRLYIKGNILQVWWKKDSAGREFKGNKGRETWRMPSCADAVESFYDFE